MSEIEKLKQENKELKQEIEKLKKQRGQIQKLGMIKQVSQGKHVSRIPFGYKWENRKLIPAQNFREVEEIFIEFLQPENNLSKVASKHNFSVNGLKKILRNFVYVGKVKFDGQIYSGNQQAIVSSTLFNRVQNKLDKLKLKKN